MTMHIRGMTALLSTSTVMALLAACGSSNPTSSPAISETTTSREPTADTPTTDIPAHDATHGVPAFADEMKVQFAKHSGTWDLVFTDVRSAQHEGFNRVVLEFSGIGIPGWSVNYVDEAMLEGSGKIVTLGGDAILNISASGTTWPAAGYYSGPTQFEPEHGGEIKDVYVGGTFEGYSQVLAGINGAAVPFRVFTLADPPRLVVDVIERGAD